MHLQLRCGPAYGQTDERKFASRRERQQLRGEFESSFASDNHVSAWGGSKFRPLLAGRCFSLSAAGGPGAGGRCFELKTRTGRRLAAHNQNVAAPAKMEVGPEKRNVPRLEQDENLNLR